MRLPYFISLVVLGLIFVACSNEHSQELDVISNLPTNPQDGPDRIKNYMWKRPKHSFPQLKISNLSDLTHGNFKKGSTYETDWKALNEIDTSTPILSLIIPVQSLYNHDTGLFVPGAIYDSLGWKDAWWSNGNYHQKGKNWERSAKLELFADGLNQYQSDVRIRVNGAIGGVFPNKSIRVYAREKSGAVPFDSQDFFETDVSNRHSINIRNGGNDFLGAMMRDVVVQEVVKDLDIGLQQSRLIQLYINGEFWGLYNLRERLDKWYFKDHYNLKSKDFCIVEGMGLSVHGGLNGYKKLKWEFDDLDWTQPAVYENFCDSFDIDNVVDYFLTQLYFANLDWPGNNVRLWKKKSGNDKWKYLLFDMDISTGYSQLYNKLDASYNMMEHAMAEKSDKFYNHPRSTILLRNLFKSDKFKVLFHQRYKELAAKNFNPNNVISVIEKHRLELEPHIEKHIARWNYPSSVREWEKSVDRMKKFAAERPAYFEAHIKELVALD